MSWWGWAIAGLLGVYAVLFLYAVAVGAFENWRDDRCADRFDRVFAREHGIDLAHTAEPRFLGARER